MAVVAVLPQICLRQNPQQLFPPVVILIQFLTHQPCWHWNSWYVMDRDKLEQLF